MNKLISIIFIFFDSLNKKIPKSHTKYLPLEKFILHKSTQVSKVLDTK
jgi:hypothetical protein